MKVTRTDDREEWLGIFSNAEMEIIWYGLEFISTNYRDFEDNTRLLANEMAKKIMTKLRKEYHGKCPICGNPNYDHKEGCLEGSLERVDTLEALVEEAMKMSARLDVLEIEQRKQQNSEESDESIKGDRL